MFKKIVLIPLLIGYLIAEAQTVVIARKTKKAIYVGADSRRTKYGYPLDQFGNPKIGAERLVDTSSMCKIIEVGKFNVAFIGHNIDNSINDAKEACKVSSSFEEAIELYIETYKETLATLCQEYKINYPDIFNEIMQEYRHAISQTIFFGYQADTAFLAIVFFSVNNDISFLPPVITPHILKRHLLYGGRTKEIRDTIEGKEIWKDGTVNAIKHLIALQSENHKVEVGGEIDILKVTRKKRKWIYQKQMCK